jgi:hypothetical protein
MILTCKDQLRHGVKSSFTKQGVNSQCQADLDQPERKEDPAIIALANFLLPLDCTVGTMFERDLKPFLWYLVQVLE